MLGVSAVLSLVVGVALACVIERLRAGFSLPEQLEATLGLPLIAMLPNVSLKTLYKLAERQSRDRLQCINRQAARPDARPG